MNGVYFLQHGVKGFAITRFHCAPSISGATRSEQREGFGATALHRHSGEDRAGSWRGCKHSQGPSEGMLSWARGILHLAVSYIKISTCLNECQLPLKGGGKAAALGQEVSLAGSVLKPSLHQVTEVIFCW